MPIWTFDLPDDVQPNLVLDLSTLSVVTAPGTGSAITVEADESLNPLLDVTADGAKVSIRQIALVGRERFAGIWPWGPQTSRVRVTVPHGTHLDARLDAGSISAEHSWEHVQIRTSAGSIRLGTVSAHTEAGSVKIVEAREGTLDLSSEMGTVSVGVPEGTAVLADCHSDFGRVATDLPRQEHPDALERRLELRARTQMGTVRVRRA